MKLTIELVPKTSWFTNCRSLLSGGEWDRIRRETYRKANYKCEVCGGTGSKWPVECHEIWEYDDVSKVQRLVGLIALCPACHQVKHIGLSQVRGKYLEALAHISKVNSMTFDQASEYVEQCFETWQARSEYDWTVDVSWLERKSGIQAVQR